MSEVPLYPRAWVPVISILRLRQRGMIERIFFFFITLQPRVE